MKRLAAAIILCAAAALAGDPVGPVFTDGTNLFYSATTQALNTAKAELYLDVQSQAFTAAAGFEVVTNFTTVTRGGSLTATATSIVVNTTQDLTVFITSSLASDTVNTLVSGHVFTNGVEFARVGWHRKLSVANDVGSAAGSSVVLDLPASTVITFRIDVDKNCTLTFEHLSIIAVQQ